MAATGLFGIHVGNSFSCISLSKDDERVEVVANDTGDRLTPTTVLWTPDQCSVGRSAVLEQSRHYNTTINRTKQLFNDEISAEELENLRGKVPYKVLEEGNTIKYELIWEGKQQSVSVKEIGLAVFKKLHSIGAMSVGGSTELQAVLTVPTYFSPKSISIVREIAEKAGFNVLQVIDEPSAAILATVPPTKQGTCMVVRVGSVSTDVTVVSIEEGLYSILSSVHKFNCGGRYITEKLRDYLISEFTRQYKGEEVSQRGKFKLETAAETAKQILSIQNVAQCSAESVGGGYDLNCSISRPRLENIVSGLLPDIMAAIRDALKQATVTAEQVNMVVFCGGTVKIPRIQDQIKAVLSKAEFFGTGAYNPDEIIATGAAMQARLASKFQYSLPSGLSMDIPTSANRLTIEIKGQNDSESKTEVAIDTVLPVLRQLDVAAGDSVKVELDAGSVENNVFVTKGPLDLCIDKDGAISIGISNLAIVDNS